MQGRQDLVNTQARLCRRCAWHRGLGVVRQVLVLLRWSSRFVCGPQSAVANQDFAVDRTADAIAEQHPKIKPILDAITQRIARVEEELVLIDRAHARRWQRRALWLATYGVVPLSLVPDGAALKKKGVWVGGESVAGHRSLLNLTVLGFHVEPADRVAASLAAMGRPPVACNSTWRQSRASF